MKFQHLSIGQEFEYQGEYYVKTTPLVANQKKTGKQKLIPRYTEIQTSDTPAPASSRVNQNSLSSDSVKATFEAYQASCFQSLDALVNKVDQATLEVTHQKIKSAGDQFLRELSLDK